MRQPLVLLTLCCFQCERLDTVLNTLSLVGVDGHIQCFLPAGKSFQTELTFKKLGYATTVLCCCASKSFHTDLGSSAYAHRMQHV